MIAKQQDSDGKKRLEGSQRVFEAYSYNTEQKGELLATRQKSTKIKLDNLRIKAKLQDTDGKERLEGSQRVL